MPKILEDYLLYLKDKNYSNYTIAEYKTDIIIFLKFIRKYNDLDIPLEMFNIFILMQIKEPDINAFLIYLNNNRQNGSDARRRKLISIRGFCKYLMIKYPKQIKDNPVKEIYIQKTKRLPKYLSIEQAKKLIGVFNEQNDKYYQRDNLIISILLLTGIRKSELINIKVKDIDFNNKSIKIIGKGNKERIIYLVESLTMQIKAFLQYNNKSIYLITTNRNTKLSNSMLEIIVKKAMKLIGVSGYGVHSLRHTYATIMYKECNDILIVKNLLGHQSINSTQIYTHINNRIIQNAVNSNPLSKERSSIISGKT